jgi:hypothetical protein
VLRDRRFLAGSVVAVAVLIAAYILGPAIVLIVRNATA